MTFRSLSVSLVLLALATLTLTGCDLFGTGDDDEGGQTDVVIANSGNFSAQDGSLTLYSPSDSSTATRDINVAFINSLALQNNRLYVIDNTQANNAGRITTFDTNDLEPIDQISNPRPPRSIGFVSDEKAYVSNLSQFDDNFDPLPSTVSVVNLESNEVTDRIDVGRSPRGIAVTDGKAFVANAASNSLSIIDTETDAVSNTMSPNCSNPKSLFVDDENEVVVVCQGSDEQSPEVLFLDPESEEVATRVPLGAPIGSINATQSAFYSDVSEELYAISGSSAFGDGSGDEIFRVDTDANAVTATLEVPENDGLIGLSAVGYDAATQDLYVTRLPVNESGGPLFAANGTALVLDRQGSVVTRFTTGNSPAHVAFLRNSQ